MKQENLLDVKETHALTTANDPVRLHGAPRNFATQDLLLRILASVIVEIVHIVEVPLGPVNDIIIFPGQVSIGDRKTVHSFLTIAEDVLPVVANQVVTHQWNKIDGRLKVDVCGGAGIEDASLVPAGVSLKGCAYRDLELQANVDS